MITDILQQEYSEDEGEVDGDVCDAVFLDEGESLFRLFNLFKWRELNLST